MSRNLHCIGLDGCKAGWVGVSRKGGAGHLKVQIFRHFDVEVCAFDIVGIDIPIGLPDAGSRQCDIAARQMIKPRGCCVFPAPLRPLLVAESYEDASKISKRINGKKISKQSFAIIPKIAEVDRLLQERPEFRNRVHEIHPEVSFCCMNNGKPLMNKKRSSSGRADRVALVDGNYGHGIYKDLANTLEEQRGWEPDDLLDACAALWSAERIARGGGQLLPNNQVKVDSTGLQMIIAY